jgi:hypothetical protein
MGIEPTIVSFADSPTTLINLTIFIIIEYTIFIMTNQKALTFWIRAFDLYILIIY